MVQTVAVLGSIIGTGRLPKIAVNYSIAYPLYRTHALTGWVANVVYFTYFTVFNSIWFVLISHLRANNGLFLVIASAKLLFLLIYLTLAISRLLYN